MGDRRTFMIGATSGLIGIAMPTWASGATGLRRSLKVDKRYLNIPVKLGAPPRNIRVELRDEIVREFSVELAVGTPDFWVFMDLTPFMRQTLTLTLDIQGNPAPAFNAIRQADDIIGQDMIYREALRPQFHFSPKRGWMNDPNGLVFHDGEYHLFYQHYPYGSQQQHARYWQQHWGHAVSTDLVHWRELPIALYPHKGLSIWSGSAVVDENNSAGFQETAEKSLVAIYTLADTRRMSTGKGRSFAQAIAYSRDRGRTWTPYATNPVLPSVTEFNRDPKVIWYAPQKKWVMMLFLDRAKYAGNSEQNPGQAMDLYRDKSSYGFFTSTDLKNWEPLCEIKIPGEAECPEFFEIPVDGNPTDTRWIIQGGSGFYLIGKFDGANFVPESGPHRLHEGNGWYASQTFNNIPSSDGRRILIPWARASRREPPIYINTPFNQSMGIPVELTLRTTSEGLRLCAVPVRELDSLRTESVILTRRSIRPEYGPLKMSRPSLIDLILVIDVQDAKSISLDLGGIRLAYEVEPQQLICGETKGVLRLASGQLSLRVLVDRTLIEIFGNNGELYQSVSIAMPAFDTYLAVSSDREIKIVNLEMYSLKSIWS